MPSSRSKLTPILRTTGRLADKGFNALVRQNRRVAQHWQSSSDLWGHVQQLNLNCAKVSLHCRASQRSKQRYQHYVDYGEYPSKVTEGWWWFRDVMLIYPLEILWAYVQPILLSMLLGLLTTVLVIVANVVFFGGIYLLLTS